MINHRTTAAFWILRNSIFGYNRLFSIEYLEQWATQQVEISFQEHRNPADVTKLLEHMKILSSGLFDEKSFKMKLALKGIETKVIRQTTESTW